MRRKALASWFADDDSNNKPPGAEEDRRLVCFGLKPVSSPQSASGMNPVLRIGFLMAEDKCNQSLIAARFRC